MGTTITLVVFAISLIASLGIQVYVGRRLHDELGISSGGLGRLSGMFRALMIGWQNAPTLGIEWLMLLWTIILIVIVIMLMGFCLYEFIISDI